MLDIKRIRDDFEGIKKAVESRGQGDYGLGSVLALDERRRSLLADVEVKKKPAEFRFKGDPETEKRRKGHDRADGGDESAFR